MSTSEAFQAQYEGYYADGRVDQKRAISARQSVGHIKAITAGMSFDSILDIGAGEGSVLQELADQKFGKTLSAVEISGSGIDAIKRREIPNLQSIERFDGYRIAQGDAVFDLGLALHVLEHVEHERLFLREAARVCKSIYVEVPLEHVGDLSRSIRISGPYGHINFYTRYSLENLLRTSGLRVDRFMVFTPDLVYEQFISGRMKGYVKHRVRRALLSAAPKFGMRHLAYIGGALCSRQADQGE